MTSCQTSRWRDTRTSDHDEREGDARRARFAGTHQRGVWGLLRGPAVRQRGIAAGRSEGPCATRPKRRSTAHEHTFAWCVGMGRCDRAEARPADDVSEACRLEVRAGGQDRRSQHRRGRGGRATEALARRCAARPARLRPRSGAADRGRRGEVGGAIRGRGPAGTGRTGGSPRAQRRLRPLRAVSGGGTGGGSRAPHSQATERPLPGARRVGAAGDVVVGWHSRRGSPHAHAAWPTHHRNERRASGRCR